jgi:hypothetical protein
MDLLVIENTVISRIPKPEIVIWRLYTCL